MYSSIQQIDENISKASSETDTMDRPVRDIGRLLGDSERLYSQPEETLESEAARPLYMSV